jgi:hypothetical protein
MSGSVVGSVGVSVVPNAEGWNAKAEEEILPGAEALGEKYGEAFRTAFLAATDDIELIPEADTGPAEAEIEGLDERLSELNARDLTLEPVLDAEPAITEAEDLTAALDAAASSADTLTASSREAAAATEEAGSSAADASAAISSLAAAATAAGDALIPLTDRERQLQADILAANPGLDAQIAALMAQADAADEAAASWAGYEDTLQRLPAEWDQVRDALLELEQGAALVVGRGGNGALSLITGGEAESFVADQSKYTGVLKLDEAMVQAAYDANQLQQAENFLGMSLDNADAAAGALRDRLVSLGLSDAEAAAGAIALSNAINTQAAAQERAAVFGQAGPLTGASLLDSAIVKATADSAALARAQEALGITEGTTEERTAAANAKLLEMGFSQDQATAGALAFSGAMDAEAASAEKLAVAMGAAETESKGFSLNKGFVGSMISGILSDPLVIIGALAAGLGFLAYEAVKLTDASGNLKEVTEQENDALVKQDKAVRFNIAGYAEHIQQLQTLRKEDEAIANLPQGEGSFIGPAVKEDNALIEQATLKYANLTSRLQILGHMYGLDSIQSLQLAKASGVSANALQAQGEAGNKAMAKIEAYANKELGAASSTQAFSQQMEIANGLAGSLATRVQALGAAEGDLFNPTLNMINTTNQLDNDMVTLKTDLGLSADSVGTLTAAQRTAGTQMSQTVSDAIANAEAIKQITGSSSQAAAPLVALRNTLDALGVHGGEARKIIAELNTAIDALHNKTVSIDVNVNTTQTGGQAPISGTVSHLFTQSAKGMVIPGYAPGRDTEHVLASKGEAIMVPEWTRAVGEDYIHAANSYYSSGRSGGSSRPRHFAQGGIAGYGANISQMAGGDTFQVFVGLLGSSATDVRSGGSSAADTVAREFEASASRTPAQIRASGKLALEDLEKYYTGPHEKELGKIIGNQTNVLTEMAKVQDKINTTIANMRQASSQEIQSLQNFSGLSSLSFRTNKQGVQEPTGAGIKTALEEKVMQLHKFFEVIGRLHHQGVSKVLIEQAIALGPEDGTAYAEAILSGGGKLIGELNRDERKIGREETAIGQRTADITYGQSITKGWLSSLDHDKEEIKKRMRELGDEIAREMIKALHGRLNIGGGGLSALDKSVALGISTLEGVAGSGTLSRADVNQIEAFLHSIRDSENQHVTRKQGGEIISLLRSNPRATGRATGNAVMAGLDGAARNAASAGRFATATRNT